VTTTLRRVTLTLHSKLSRRNEPTATTERPAARPRETLNAKGPTVQTGPWLVDGSTTSLGQEVAHRGNQLAAHTYDTAAHAEEASRGGSTAAAARSTHAAAAPKAF
jgi:hypothetical protein